ncbi:MAG: ABC transporter permease [Brooklawnia sp.]|uniref:ABC transporter permease n=1 Tax=Brooklawnia sp. TaxID=2699740 RepID=UPI003C786866
MSVDTQPRRAAAAVEKPIEWKMPITYGVLTLVALVVYVFAAPTGEQTTFQLARGEAWITIPNFDLPARPTGIVITLVLAGLAALAAWNASRRQKTGWWLPATFGFLFVFGFLVYAGAGASGVIPLTTLLAGGLALSVPLIFGAMCGLVGERSGIVNIAIEGQLLLGAFFAAVAASLASNAYVGLLAAPIAGALVGALLVWFAVSYWVDQIIIGVVLNVLVVGLTNFLFSTVLTQNSETWNARQRLPNLPIPGLSEIPVLGPVLFDQTILVYIMYAVVILLNIFVFRSRWGLRMRAVGEHPKAADTVGIKVNRTRVVNTIFAGAIAGLGGAFFTVGTGLAFGKEMSAGQGYIALAAMILGKWNPYGALGAALLFGFSRNLGNLLSSIGTPVPSEFLLMLPYVVTIFAVAGFVGRVRAPAAENIPYKK